MDKRPLHLEPSRGVARDRRSSRSRFAVVALITSLLGLYTTTTRYFTVSAGDLAEVPSTKWKHPHPHNRKAEEAFLSIPNPTSAIAASRLFATKPHLAGSKGDLDTAKDFLTLFQQEFLITPPSEDPIFSSGSPASQHATRSIHRTYHPRAWIDTYYPVMNTPLDRSLQVLDSDGSILWDADLVEHPDETDPEAAKFADAVPTFHGLSPAGDVRGVLVNGHYCRKEDYDALVLKGVDLKGKLVLCRYGAIFRGLKVKGGQDLGAVGVLIYSDPRDDGTVTVENGYTPYPHGPARNPTSVQRGSVQYLSVYPGDPTTPGYPSYENSTRTVGSNIPRIPSLPISWFNAKMLLKNTAKGGKWEGKEVRLVNEVDTKVTPIWNTMSVIPGHIKDEIVVVGNHRDAWVMGAVDPSSGTVSLYEVVRGLGALWRGGWRPLRTILIVTWDAEEYGLIGSTEWGEDFADWISKNVVAYLNLDSSVSGSRLRVSASPLLSHFLKQTAEDLPHPTDEGRTLWDAKNDSGKLFGNTTTGSIIVDAEATHIRESMTKVTDTIGVSPLGSGSDYTVFLQRLGIPSTNGGFSSTLSDPVYHYHSVFDSERWQELYGDPGFFRHVVVAKYLGLQILRLSDTYILPFNTTHYAYELERYLDKVGAILLESQFELDLKPLRTSIHNLQATSRIFDIHKAEVDKELKRALYKPHSRFSEFIRTVRRHWRRLKRTLHQSCTHVSQHTEDEASPSLRRGHGRIHQAIKSVTKINNKLRAFEKGFLSEEGIKEREWFKHFGVAPGRWLGYGATTLPGLTEALTLDRNLTLAQYEAGRLKELIDTLTETLGIN